MGMFNFDFKAQNIENPRSIYAPPVAAAAESLPGDPSLSLSCTYFFLALILTGHGGGVATICVKSMLGFQPGSRHSSS